MTDLNRLRVSLTKHNAHKIARLLKNYGASEVFARLGEVEADASQARKNLSTFSDDALPNVWAKAQRLGPDAVDALVLLALIFSHRDLINAMTDASDRNGFIGRIERDKQLVGKAYTNFVRWIDQLGYATRIDYEAVTFNLKNMFRIPGFGPLVSDLIALKLTEAKWDNSNSVADEAATQNFHRVFGVKKSELREWLNSGAQPAAATPVLTPKDAEFFGEETEGSSPGVFVFRPGHQERDVEPVTIAASPKSKANRLHNDIQNKLYAHLKAVLGAKHVGTEIDTGSGTSIDLVTQLKGSTTFYEIKTGASVRASIRQALPQLLEYAFWPAHRRAVELIIVSHLPVTKAASRYVAFLRNEFGLPIAYRQFDLQTLKLI